MENVVKPPQGVSLAKYIKDFADSYEESYTFMCVNATLQAAKMALAVNDHQTVDECRMIYVELRSRGYDIIETKEEYEAKVKVRGVPPIWQQRGENPFGPN